MKAAPWWTWLGSRRAIGLQFGLFVVAGVVWLAPRSSSWLGSWKQALDLAAGATGFVGSMAAGAACLAYARLRRSAVNELLMQGTRNWLRWLQPLLAIWTLASAALLVLALGATTLASLAGVPSYWESAWILVPSLLMLGAQTAIGAAVGFSSGRVWLAPFAVVLVFSLALLSAVGLFPAVFGTGGATGPLGGTTFAVWPVLSPGVAAIGIAACVLAACHRPLFLSSWPRRVVVGVGMCAWATGWLLAPPDGDARYVLVADPPLTCAGAEPQVCVFEETPRPLDDLAARMHRQSRALVGLGVPMPERFAQSYGGGRGRSEGAVVLRDRDTHSTVTDDLATDSLVKPSSSCAADRGSEPPYLALEARHLLGRWLQVQAGILVPGADDGDRAWLTSGLEVQEPWVRATYAQLSACAFDQIELPDGLG